MHPLLASFEQLATSFRQGRALVQVADEFEDVLALKVAAWGDAVGGHEGIRFTAQNFSDLVWRPHEELALHAFTVGILRAVKGNTCGIAVVCACSLRLQLPRVRELPGVDACVDTQHLARNVA